MSTPSPGRRARPVVALALAALLVLAGCGGPTDAGATTTTTTTERTTTAATTEPTTAATTTTVSPELDPSSTSFLDAHVAALHRAGSVTVRSNLSVVRNGTRGNQSLVGRFDLDGGRALVRRRPQGGARSTTYLAANGSAYSRQTLFTGKTRLFGNDTTPAPNVTGVLRHRSLRLLGDLSLAYRGEGRYRGVGGHVYRATNVSAVDDDLLGDDDVTVPDFEYGLVVADAGHVRLARYELTFRRNGTTISAVDRVRFEAVGGTTVTRPAWLRAAVEKSRRPDPDDQVTRSYAVETGDGRVVQRITAKKYDQREGVGVGPTVSENPMFYNEVGNATRVAPVVRLYWPDSTIRVNATFHYDDADVPEGNESGLTVAIVDRELGTYVSVENVGEGATVERRPEADAISVVIEAPDLLERLQGHTFFAMNVGLFRERAFGDRGGDDGS